MTELEKFLDLYINEDLIRIIISGPRQKEGPSKIQIRPLLLKGQVMYQVTRTVGQKELHENHQRDEVLCLTDNWMQQEFRQLQLEAKGVQGTVLASKKGRLTIKTKKIQGREDFVPMLAHNRQKKYLLQEGVPVPYLIDLGIMNEAGKVKHARYDKFKQLNRFLEFIEDILPNLNQEEETTIIDFGCGKSYLTFAMYHYLKVLKEYPVRIIGLDLKQDVIDHCSRLARQYGYDGLDFYHGDIASYEGVDHVDMVVTLHACDTATDFALKKAVDWGAKVILSVPCCQHELAKQISCDIQKPVLQYGLIKERMAALYTDAIRAQVLERCGYRTQILEFIDMEHTPKNILIRGIRQGRKAANEGQLKELLGFLGITPAAVRLLAPELCTDET